MSLLNSIGSTKLLFLKLFQICGFIPLHFDLQNDDNRYPFVIWSLFLMAANSFKSCIVFFNYEKLVYTRDDVGEIHDASKLISLTLVHQIILLVSFLKRHKIRNVFLKVVNLHKSFSYDSKESSRENKEKDFKFKLKFFGLFIYLVCAESKLLAKKHDIEFVYYWAALAWDFLPIYMFYFYSILWLDVVHVELIRINHVLSELIRFVVAKQDYKCRDKFDDYIAGKLGDLQERYQMVFELVADMNDIFGWSWTIVVFNNAIALQCSSYWIYWFIYNGINGIDLEIFLTGVPVLIVLLFTLNSAENCTDEAKSIAYQLHNLESIIENVKLSVQIQTFSLQLCHEPIEFSADGFFTFDLTIVKSIFATITMYMVFFIQITPDYGLGSA